MSMTSCLPWEGEMELNSSTNMEIEFLLEAIYRLSGYDFRQYARSSINRRIFNRMRMENMDTVTALLEKVIHEPGFLDQILNDFSINVTEMFRDPDFFKALREEVVPELSGLQQIRIWHAGCSSGEEVFSMAIILEEAGLLDKSLIYATDFNEDILEMAKQGIFPLNKMQLYTKNYLKAGGTRAFSEYYKTDHQHAYIDPKLMKNIIFWQHNLVTDQTFNEFDVIICRNVLIYFTTALQSKVQRLFYESLPVGGFLGLGDKETLRFSEVSQAYELFVPGEQIYQKVK